MKKLDHIPPNTYRVNSTKQFQGKPIERKTVLSAFDFSREMCFGKGHHRDHRTGGKTHRRNGEKFCNAFQGKLAEMDLFAYFKQTGVDCPGVDCRIMGENQWDDSDFTINGKHLNVKSAAFFSNLLLLEKEDWSDQGLYLQNMENKGATFYDFFILIRIKPDIKSIMKKNRVFFSDSIDSEKLLSLIEEENWSFDIPGFINHEKLVESVIVQKHILPQGSLLNGRVKMDADNYYVQAGDLRPIGGMVKDLNPQ